jgi:chromosome partitioning protein
MAETIAVLSLKGGTGKTTTVRTLADVFRRIGLDVLCVDLDPQGNLSDYFDVAADASPTVADVLSGAAKAKAATHDGIIPASPSLAEVERGLSGKMGRELVLRKALKEARKQHDLILIDCPPALGLLTINGLVASDWALISAEAQYFALQGVSGALEVVAQAKEFYNDDLEFVGVVMNIADMRTVHSRGRVCGTARALRREGVRDRDPPVDRLRGVRRVRPLDPRAPARPRAGLPRAGRRGACANRAQRLAAQAGADVARENGALSAILGSCAAASHVQV